MADFGKCADVVVRTDSSGGLAVGSLRGLGRFRHVQTRHLWVQQRVQEGDLRLKKEPTDTNVSDAPTKPLGEKRTVGSGAKVSTYSRRVTTPWRSVVKMTRRTVRGHVRLEEIFNHNKNGGLKRTFLMIRRKSKTGGIKHTCQVVKLGAGAE